LEGYGKIEDSRAEFIQDKSENDTTSENFIYEGEFHSGMFHGQGTITKKFIDVAKMRQKIDEQEGKSFRVFVNPASCHNSNGGKFVKSGTFHMGTLQGECLVVDHDLHMQIKGLVDDNEQLVAGVVSYEKEDEFEHETAFATTTENQQRFVSNVPLNFPVMAKL
jgi:hypothetical protein